MFVTHILQCFIQFSNNLFTILQLKNCGFNFIPVFFVFRYFYYCWPDAVQSIISFCKENLSTISVETVHQHIHDSVIPKLVNKIAREQSQDNYCKEILFSEYRIKTLTLATTFSMSKLGFNYHPRKKCYYVDSHESPENVA